MKAKDDIREWEACTLKTMGGIHSEASAMDTTKVWFLANLPGTNASY